MSLYRLTEKQIQILSVIHQHRMDQDEAVDMDQLLAELPYTTSKESMQFSLRALIKKGFIKKNDQWAVRRGRARRTYDLTEFGKTMLRL
ncbi:hypothetical protein R0J87_09225 [Halomonas sp. SIMBA_159]|uniref:hypothetical protein n=1 Tax=Halomonas sp. BMC6 TaxID=3073244 RepID=UPI0030CE982A